MPLHHHHRQAPPVPHRGLQHQPQHGDYAHGTALRHRQQALQRHHLPSQQGRLREHHQRGRQVVRANRQVQQEQGRYDVELPFGSETRPGLLRHAYVRLRHQVPWSTVRIHRYRRVASDAFRDVQIHPDLQPKHGGRTLTHTRHMQPRPAELVAQIPRLVDRKGGHHLFGREETPRTERVRHTRAQRRRALLLHARQQRGQHHLGRYARGSLCAMP